MQNRKKLGWTIEKVIVCNRTVSLLSRMPIYLICSQKRFFGKFRFPVGTGKKPYVCPGMGTNFGMQAINLLADHFVREGDELYEHYRKEHCTVTSRDIAAAGQPGQVYVFGGQVLAN